MSSGFRRDGLIDWFNHELIEVILDENSGNEITLNSRVGFLDFDGSSLITTELRVSSLDFCCSNCFSL